ncbi:MAG: HAD family hydrolase [Termitinemataceae bacterium]|nr:MAG: HAD family hydrolase [Termitinemataceae bacterium]
MKDFDAIAFDLDGTLYADWRFYMKLIPYTVINSPLLFAFGRARSTLRKSGDFGDFHKKQAALCAEYLGITESEAYNKLQKNIYDYWPHKFKNIELYPHVLETLKLFKKCGLKLGILSDFRLKYKIENLNLENIFDAELSTGDVGALKPHKQPFLELAGRLNTNTQRILYVGNHYKYDILGAKNAGFGAAALICRNPFKNLKNFKSADFIFKDYRQLQRFVLE